LDHPSEKHCVMCPEVKRLADLGFIPNQILEIKEVGIFGSPLLVKVMGAEYAICDKIAEHIIVEEIKNASRV